MLDILNFLNAHNMPIFQSILMILVSKFMVHRALSDKTYLSLGLLSPLKQFFAIRIMTRLCMSLFLNWQTEIFVYNDNLLYTKYV